MADTPLTYAIGDIHGCADMLDALLDKIEAHAAGRERRLVFVGDYIDRGPDSARVVETLKKLQYREPDNVVCLMGNHEDMLLKAFSEPGGMELWLHNGGFDTLSSFGVERAGDISRDVLDWIENLPTVHQDDLRWYVHAGFRPDAPVPDPDIHSRLWIRDAFLNTEHDFGRHVIHGHTPQVSGKPERLRFRTNIDTAAVFACALTAAILTPDEAKPTDFLQVLAS